VLIDPVFEQHQRDAALMRELDLQLLYTLDTHCHADHVTGAWLMKQALGSGIALAAIYGAQHVDRALAHGDEVRFGAHRLRVHATPGHTPGCLSFVTSDQRGVFTGDALLIRGAGRTDFQANGSVTCREDIAALGGAPPNDLLLTLTYLLAPLNCNSAESTGASEGMMSIDIFESAPASIVSLSKGSSETSLVLPSGISPSIKTPPVNETALTRASAASLAVVPVTGILVCRQNNRPARAHRP
jgi:hypothetical protein